ncbi:MAG TPA: MraY family glycosyltransferase [Acidimicrobiales bacterium]|nr:MraY family glycosyltransferase [Acidimicrobiales bacterium]
MRRVRSLPVDRRPYERLSGRAEVAFYASYVAVFAIAAAATFLLTFPVRRIALRFGALAQPGEARVHMAPTPTVGGAAMLVGAVVAMAAASRLAPLAPIFRGSSEPVGVVLGGLVIYAVGLVDDVRDISAPAKVAGQVLAAMVLVSLGVTMYYFKIPFVAGPIVLAPSALPLVTAVWVVGMANAVNLIDGLDGLAAGIVGIASGALCVYGLQLEHLGDLTSDNLGPVIAVIACGVCVGFLPHNFHPARVFMGDGGALFLGLLTAAATMEIGGRVGSPTAAKDVAGLTFFRFAPLFIPFFILGVPILDTAFAIVRRTVRRASLAQRDLGHLHHRLLLLGHGHRRSVLVLWAWTAVLSAVALLPTFDSRANAYVPVGAAVLGVALYTLFRPGSRTALAEDAPPSAPAAAGAGPAAKPLSVVMSTAAGVAVAGERDLASPRRARRRARRHARRRTLWRGRGADQGLGSRFARPDDPMRG